MVINRVRMKFEVIYERAFKSLGNEEYKTQLSTFLIVSPASRVAMRTQLFTMIPLAKIMCNVVMEMNRWRLLFEKSINQAWNSIMATISLLCLYLLISVSWLLRDSLHAIITREKTQWLENYFYNERVRCDVMKELFHQSSALC